MTAKMLRSAGFEVRSAATMAEATAILEAHDIELEALLTDVVLKGERGTELVAIARRLRPTLRIVVMSGYAPDPDAVRLLVEHRRRVSPQTLRT